MQESTKIIIPPLNKYKLYIFDLDGTLYDQQILRRIIFRKILAGLVKLKYSFTEIRIIGEFRRQRELHKGYSSDNLEAEQYSWCADKLKIPLERVKKTIDHFIFRFPLQFLHQSKYKNIDRVFATLKDLKLKTAVYSDYPAKEKLEALNLNIDLHVCSMDSSIAQLKPNASGLLKICNALNIPKDETVFIGDREDTDGESARMAGTDFIKVNVKEARRGDFFSAFQKKLISAYD
ncbi:MAG: HAD family hydrolase [Bacteroidales bacterium]|nr:HAD family hydrolase [Bacteroidales bacterium]